MEFRDQDIARRVVYATLAFYALTSLFAGLIPFLTFGVSPDLSGDPVDTQMELARNIAWSTNANAVAFYVGAAAVVAFGVWVYGAYRNLDALGIDYGALNRISASVLCVVPGLNVLSGPVVVHRLLSASEDAAGDRAEWFRFEGWHLVVAWVVAAVMSLGLVAYVTIVFYPPDDVSQVADLFMLIFVGRGFDVVVAGITALLVHRIGQLQVEAHTNRDVSDVFE